MLDVAPLTWGGIIGNIQTAAAGMMVSMCRPINLGRNHWKLSTVEVPDADIKRRPINLGRNHWKRSGSRLSRVMLSVCRPINLGRNHWKLGMCVVSWGLPVNKVAPLTWGGIIGNLDSATFPSFSEAVAPLTWGGIIGNCQAEKRWL